MHINRPDSCNFIYGEINIENQVKMEIPNKKKEKNKSSKAISWVELQIEIICWNLGLPGT